MSIYEKNFSELTEEERREWEESLEPKNGKCRECRWMLENRYVGGQRTNNAAAMWCSASREDAALATITCTNGRFINRAAP